MNRIGAFLMVALLAACSSTPEALEKDTKAASSSKSYSQNYQEIYRRVYGVASRCMVASNSSTQFAVDAQLYTELGFGEITQSLVTPYGRNYYLKVKIEKAGSGSRMTVQSGNTLMQGATLRKVFAWADGGTSC